MPTLAEQLAALAEENALLHRQIQAIKQAVLLNAPLIFCYVCKHKNDTNANCNKCRKSKTACNWQPPEVDNDE